MVMGIVSTIALLWWVTRIVRERIGVTMTSLDFLLWESEFTAPIYDQLVFEFGDDPLE
jgi:hypothetical protein